ncbi:MAG TPA: metallophosphoesterase [Terriglobales bacterium]|nr:metallophosphoesterase [Terriglobales bacterium]
MSISALRLLIPILFLVTLYLSQRYWVRSARRAITAVRHPRWRAALRALWTITGLLLLLAVLERFAAFHRTGWPIPRVSRWSSEFLALWFTWSMFGFLAIYLVRGLDWLGRRSAALVRTRQPAMSVSDPPVDAGRRYFLRTATYAAGALPLAGALYGFAVERFDFEVFRVEVPLPGLPHGLDGLRILQLSDIHASNYMPISQVRRIVDTAQQLTADLIVSTGDLLTGRGDPLAACVAELSRLRAPLGVWGCNGNHEIYTDTEDEAALLFRQHGMTMLRQENAQLAWRGAKFNLIGVDYQRQHWFNSQSSQMLEGVEYLVQQDMLNILLSHNPNAFRRASEIGVDLMLAGHTHGGQVQVEILDHRLSPARFITKYIAGLYRRPMDSDGASASRDRYASVYVSRGLGTIGTPLRLGVPPEITLLTLRRARDS